MTFEREESRSPVPTRASRRSHERKIKVSVVTDELAKQKVGLNEPKLLSKGAYLVYKFESSTHLHPLNSAGAF